MTVQLFIPCYVDQFAPHVAHTLCNLLDKLNVSWVYPADQTCCGQFAFNAGDWHSARQLMRNFFKVFDGDDIIICPSASCVLTVRRLYPQLVETASDAVQLGRLQPLVLEFTEWFSSLLPLPFPMHFPGKVFLHQSCAARKLGILEQLKQLLVLVSNLQLQEISSTYSCCGFGGLFSLKRPDLAQAIGSNYLKAVQGTDAEAIVSPDVGCLLHLQGILRAKGLNYPVYYVAELIFQALQCR